MNTDMPPSTYFGYSFFKHRDEPLFFKQLRNLYEYHMFSVYTFYDGYASDKHIIQIISLGKRWMDSLKMMDKHC